MKKYAKIINDETKQCEIGLGTNAEYYKSIGMEEMEVEEAYDRNWYVKGYAPEEPEPTEEEKRINEINSLKDFLADTDYTIIKIAEGVATPEDYAEVIAQRQSARARIRELEA